MKKITIVVAGIVLLGLTRCAETPQVSEKDQRVPVVLCFDVEDYTSPGEVGMDDIPKWLSEIMTEEGVTGSFFVIGEKARMMERRGRSDVISAMARHDIGSHTNHGSIHPTVTELLEKAGWQEGVELMAVNESAGIDELGRIFGQRPVNLARHGGSYGPQLVAALGEMGAGYVYSPISLPGHNAVWFCNTLNFHGEGDFGFFDDAYYRDELFDPMLEALDSLIPASISDIDVVPFFGCHPSKVRSIQFWDFNYYKGANPEPGEWQTPELRPLESMETARKNFRRLIRYLAGREDIELTTFREMSKRFSFQREEITPDELEKIAGRIQEEHKIIIDDHYSPAEIFYALTVAISNQDTGNPLPSAIQIERPLGPLEMPLEKPEVRQLPWEAVTELALDSKKYMVDTGHLPATLSYQGQLIGTGSLLALFSDFFLHMKAMNMKESLEVSPMEPFPSYHEQQIIQEVASCKTWPVHREDLDMALIIEATRLQMWTLKPAWPITPI
jgi:hypothetical protein